MFYDLWRLFDLCLLEGSTNVMPTSEMDYELCSAMGSGTRLSRGKMERVSRLIEKQT